VDSGPAQPPWLTSSSCATCRSGTRRPSFWTR
jgi:hypothetical protein